MTNRGWLILCVGGALVTVGLLALNFPVFLDGWDEWGVQIKCGTGYITNLDQAQFASRAAPHSHFGEQCQRALGMRRAWAIPVAVAGWILLSGMAVALWRHAAPQTEAAAAD
jgi:hypothetical protein